MISSLKRLFSGRNWLPGYILNRKPLLLAAYDTDFLRNRREFAAALPDSGPVHLLLQLGWQHETDSAADGFSAELKAAMEEMPDWNITVLANTPGEEEQLRKRGIKAVFCHQNAFLDETRYPLLRNPRKEFDAVYIARLSPFKRHPLAEKIRSLRLIGDYSANEIPYKDSILQMLSHAPWTRKVLASRIYRVIETARCGLCLSEEEGAMFVSAEYLLCGIPVVNTPNLGGRDLLMPDFAVRTVSPDADAVADAVQYWKQNPPEPEKIRAAFLEKAQVHRQRLKELIQELTGAVPVPLPHKLGIRTRVMPWKRPAHGIRRKKQDR